MNEESKKDSYRGIWIGCKVMLAYDDYDSNKAEAPANFVPAAAVIRKE